MQQSTVPTGVCQSTVPTGVCTVADTEMSRLAEDAKIGWYDGICTVFPILSNPGKLRG